MNLYLSLEPHKSKFLKMTIYRVIDSKGVVVKSFDSRTDAEEFIENEYNKITQIIQLTSK